MDPDLDSLLAGLQQAPSIPEQLHIHTERRPEQRALSMVGEKADGNLAFSFGELETEARRTATWMMEHLAPGSRVMLLYSSGAHFAAAFLGCLYAAMVAVPVPLPGRFQQQRRRVTLIANDAQVAAVLTETADLESIADWIAADHLPHLVPRVTDVPSFGDARGWTLPRINRSTLGLLQYTSGSTGEPKGVMVTHGNLLHNMHSIACALALQAPVCTGGWIPLYHDMGLMGHLLPGLCFGGGCVLMSPNAFLKRPLRWLQVIDQYGIELSAAPNFGYERCLSHLTAEQIAALDLSRWRYACNGSEPIRARTLDAFAERFAPAGFRKTAFFPCYGMAEATLLVSGTAGREPVTERVDAVQLAQHVFCPTSDPVKAQRVVSSGIIHGSELRIVEPQSGRALQEGQIGEIWLRGGGVAQGYWNKALATEQTFRAWCADGEGPFLRTGDLGTRRDGEVFVTGRLKDLIIVKGRNLYPEDIEQELRLHHRELSDLVGAVFSVDDTQQESVVVSHEIQRAPWSDEQLRSIAIGVRATVAREFGFTPSAVLLLRSNSVLRTTSGKVRRSAMRQLFLSNELDALYQHQDGGMSS